MTATFDSVREALVHYYTCRRGPRPARMKYTADPSASTATHRDGSEWLVIGGCLHTVVKAAGLTMLAVDRRLRAWALADEPRDPEVRRLEERLRVELRAVGLVRPPLPRRRSSRAEGVVVRPVEEAGRTVSTLRTK